MGVGRQVKDLHMYNMIAVENRIPAFHLSNTRPVSEYTSFNLQTLLPSVNDNALLKCNWIQLVGRIIVKYLKQMEWMSSYIDTRIPHPYLKELSKKSNVVSASASCVYVSGTYNASQT